MPLYKFKEFYPDYRNTFSDSEIINLDSYSVYSGDENIGSVDNVLVDDTGRFRYLVVDTGFWIFGKKVLLPIGLARFDYDAQRIYVDGLTKEQVENLPDYKEAEVTDQDTHEERTREAYRPLAAGRNNRQYIENAPAAGAGTTVANRAQGYDYDRNPNYYGLSEQDNQRRLRLYEERLIANKRRDRVGEVRVGKHVETETAEVSVPVEKERVVVERRTPTQGQPVKPGEADFREGEVARMEVYEETADINKQAFVREEVGIRKEVDRDTVSAKEKVRREELDIDTEGRPNVNREGRPRIDRDR